MWTGNVAHSHQELVPDEGDPGLDSELCPPCRKQKVLHRAKPKVWIPYSKQSKMFTLFLCVLSTRVERQIAQPALPISPCLWLLGEPRLALYLIASRKHHSAS